MNQRRNQLKNSGNLPGGSKPKYQSGQIAKRAPTANSSKAPNGKLTLKVDKNFNTPPSPALGDIMNALRDKKKGRISTVTNLFDVLLQASCAVSSFKDALEERRNTVFTEESKLFPRAHIKEIAELRLLDIISRGYEYQWNSLSPIEFLVKVFATLDKLKRARNTIGSIFSICMNNVTNCRSCNSRKSVPVNLGVLQIVDLERFESNISADEKLYFNHKQAGVEELSIQDKQQYTRLLLQESSKKTLERLLADCFCVQPKENKLCSKCKVKTEHNNLSILQTLSSGLIVMLPGGWSIAEVPESINLRDCPAASATYQLRAAVLQVPNSKNKGNGTWVYAKELVNIHLKSMESPLLLFYEKEVRVTTKLCKKADALDVKHQSRLIGLSYFLEKMKPIILKNLTPPFQRLKHEILIIKQEREVATRSVASPQRPAIDPRGKWECAGPTAPLEAAVRGLFSIRAFTTFLRHPFTTERLQTSDFLRHFNTIYGLYLQGSTLTNKLEKEVLQVKDNFLHVQITNLLTKFDRNVAMESRNTFPRTETSVLSELTSKRYNTCQVLHDVFSVLMKNKSSYFWSSPWTYSRVLDIPLRVASNTCARGSIIDLEECMQLWGQSNQLTVCYIGSALIIRLLEEGSNKSQGVLIRVPKILDLNRLRIMATSMYHLRAVVYSPEKQQSATFIVQEVIDAQDIDNFLKKGCNASVLFYEQEETCTIQEKADNSPSDKSQSRINENMPDKIVVQDHGSRPMSSRNRTNKGFIYGLQNLGNTCFMNSALNGLYSLTSFRSYITTQENQNPLMKALLRFCKTHTREQVQTDLLYQFKRSMKEFDDGRQHCANSYIFKLLMLLDTLLPTPPSTTFPQDIFGNKLRQYRKGKCEQLHDIFGTLAENLFICIECSHTRRNFSYFRTVDVPIPYYAKTFGEVTMFSPNNFYPGQFAKEYTGTEVSEIEYRQEFLRRSQKLTASISLSTLSHTDLYECFKYMLRASLMSPQSLMQCDNCGYETQHYKQTFFRRLSTTFVIHFQRFDERDGRKLNTPVDFPMDLHMSDYCVNDPREYQLCGVVYHFGSLDSGHYTACIKVEGRWYDVNDSSVREVSGKLRHENAYILFYEEGRHAST